VSGKPEPGTVSPLTEEELREAFGTVTPSAEQVRSGAGQWRDRWVGTYVVSYRDGRADQIHFYGTSGD
jgi:hypothetical protein